MKLQISYNTIDLLQAINFAQKTATFADILEVGTLLIYKDGVNAVKTFRSNFPCKRLFVDAKISEKANDAVELFASAGANMITVLAGVPQATIKKAVSVARKFDVDIVIDVFDIQTAGQIALDAKSIGVDAILLHHPPDPFDLYEYTSHWNNIQANTDIPLIITGNIDKANIDHIKWLKPHCVAIGTAITKEENPTTAAQFFKSVLE